MVEWTADEKKIIENAQNKDYKTVLREIPDEQKRWKCFTCKLILDNNQLNDNKCPNCGEDHLVQMCPLDHNGCGHDVTFKIELCPVCKEPHCSVCGCHDVVALSRITGYIQDYSGFNSAKKQEISDRTRYVVA